MLLNFFVKQDNKLQTSSDSIQHRPHKIEFFHVTNEHLLSSPVMRSFQCLKASATQTDQRQQSACGQCLCHKLIIIIIITQVNVYSAVIMT